MQDKPHTLWQWLKNEKRAVWFEYSVLTLAIVLPLLLPGYVLTLDLVFTPHFELPTELTNTYPLQALLWLTHFVIPGDVIEKIIIFLILVFSGVGAHTLMRSINVKKDFPPELWRVAVYFGGIFYMINPFTYSRFMAGQWLFLLGYAMMPFFIKAFLRFFSLPSRKTLVPLIIWMFAIMSSSVHHAGIMLIIMLITLIGASILGYWRDKAHVQAFLRWSGVALVITIVLTSYWAIPAIMGSGSIGSAIAHMNDTHFKAFATGGTSVLGTLGEVVRLQGFWPETRQLYALPQSMVPAWGLVFLFVWILVVIGAVKAWKSYRLLTAFAGGCIIVGITLAATPLLEWLSHLTALAAGYREPHKFASLVALGYAMLGTFGTAFIIRWATARFNETAGQVAIVACLLLPLAATPVMLWGFGGQLAPRHYPAEWYEMNQTLKQLPQGSKTLFLPWHQYMAFRFSDRIIANPAEKFFDTPVIASDNPEFMSVPPTRPDVEKDAISKALKQPETLTRTLSSHGIGYILFDREDDGDNYPYVDAGPHFTVVSKSGNLTLYKVRR